MKQRNFSHSIFYRIIIIIGLVVIVNIPCSSQNVNTDKIDEYILKRMQDRKIPGIAMAVIKNGTVIKEGYYGSGNLETNDPIIDSSVFEIASMSKQFTCAAVLLLQQDGKISINDKLSKYLDSLPFSWKNITLEQLMNHTSGMRDDWDEPTPYFLANYTDSLMLIATKKVPLKFNSGTAFHYSSGPFILGLIIAKVSGVSIADFLKNRIFDPLGMKTTSVYNNRTIVPHRVSGYVIKDSMLMNGTDISPAAEARGDVGIITSKPDMIRWATALQDDRLLNEASRKAMFTQGKLSDGTYLSHGYGWFIYPYLNQIAIEHGGGFRTGFSSDIMIFPNKSLIIIVFANLWTTGTFTMMTEIAGIVDAQFIKPSLRQPKNDPDKKRTEKLKDLILDVAAKKWDDTQLNQQVNFGGFTALDLQEMLKGFKNLLFIEEQNLKTNPLHLYGEKITKSILYKIIAHRDSSYWLFGYNDKGKLVYAVPQD
ncbi:MAG: serine hydrolase domain-containing protein [Chitinophagaceae bacterium]